MIFKNKLRNTVKTVTALLAVMLIGATGCGNIATLKEEEANKNSTEIAEQAMPQAFDEASVASMMDAAKKEAYDAIVEIDVENYGKIKLKLNAEAAPITVANFIKLVNEGFYDGLTFNRVMPGFMIQGGDPNGDGTGGSGKTIYGEFAANGYDNPISHKRGVISMANSSADPNSASSQFFIMHEDAPHLDGNYAAFGKVIEGIETVDEIASVKVDFNDKPLEPQVMKKVSIVDQ